MQRSFYCDTSYGPRYFTYIADELPEICSRWFRLDESRENTFIAGESMGGYGAMKAALSRPQRFAAAASLSGALDYAALCCRILNSEWRDMQPRELRGINGTVGLPETQNDLLYLLRKTAQPSQLPRLLQLCGTEDFLYEDNQAFRKAAQEAGCDITYPEGPGDHEWPYWDKAIQRAFQFFCGLDLHSTPIY